MPTGTYTIDATNNAEPLDTRYVADFPAELRAMKTRMNSAISSIGSLTGALMADGTNNMTGKLGVGTVADAGKMLHVVGDSKLVGNVDITGKLSATGNSFLPTNGSVVNAYMKTVGAYGGGMVMVDGATYGGSYIIAGALYLGLGSASGLAQKLKIGTASAVHYGDTTADVAIDAATGYASLTLVSAGTNASYIFFTNKSSGEVARIYAGNDGSMYFVGAAGATTRFAIYNDNTTQTLGSVHMIGTPAALAARQLQFYHSSRTMSLVLNTDNSFALYDNTAGINRFITDTSGNFTASGNVTAYSDVRLKKDITTIHGALRLVQDLRGVRYKWKRDNSAGIGFVAQEVEEICPELVLDSGTTKSVAYGNITAILVEAVKELSAQVVELRQQVMALQEGK